MTERKLQVGKSFWLPIEAITQTFSILAKRGVGKTYTGSVHAEEMLKAGAHVVVLDPTGAWWGLRSSADGKSPGFPIVILGGDHGDVPLESTAGETIANFVVEERVSVVLDLQLFRKNEQARFVTDFLETLYRRNREAVHVFVDEADAFAPQRPLHGQERMLGAVEDIVRRGRIKGIGATLITQRSAVLNKNVLTQTEVLIALRTIAPQDQDAIDAWIQAHDVQEKRETMMASLASLPIGTAWYWSPGWLDIFKKVEVRERETFNSSATPKPGEVRRTPKTLADVDLSLLHTKIAATIEKAKQEDPRELRRRISGLEAELRKKAPAGAAAPAVRPAEDLKRRTNEAYDRGWKESAKEHERRQSILARSIRSVGHLAHQVRELAEKVDDVLAGLPETFTAYKFRGNPTPEIPQLKAEPKEVVWKARMPAIDAEFRSKVDPVPEGELRLTKAHHRILAALAQLHGIGVERPSKTQAALWAGYSPTSGGYYNYLGQLRSAGLVDYGGDATMFLTPEGRSAVESAPERPEIPGSVQDLQEQVFRMVGDSKTRILRALIEAYPRPMPKPELAERAGFSPTSGGYYNYLGTLRSMGLIDYVDGQAVATSVLFLEGSS